MKISMTAMLAAGLVLSQVGCQTQQKIAMNQAAAQGWLGEQKTSARIEVSGTWFSSEWGTAKLKQSGRDISGTLDTYEVKGVVSGNKAYITTWDSGKCYHAIILSSPGKNALKGTYTDGPTYRTEAKQQQPVELRRSY